MAARSQLPGMQGFFEMHNASLRAFYSNFGDVQTADEVVASLKRGLGQAAA